MVKIKCIVGRDLLSRKKVMPLKPVRQNREAVVLGLLATNLLFLSDPVKGSPNQQLGTPGILLGLWPTAILFLYLRKSLVQLIWF